MAIDTMKKVTMVCQVTAAQRLIRRLHELSVVELTDTVAHYEGAEDQFERPEVSTEECDGQLQKVHLILGLIDLFAPEEKSFIAGLAPVPMIIDEKEIEDGLHQAELDAHYDVALELDSQYRQVERRISDIRNQLQELAPFADLPFRVAELSKPERVRLVFGAIPPNNLDAMAQDPAAMDVLAWERVVSGQFLRKNGSGGTPAKENAKRNEPVRLVVAFLRAQEEAAREVLSTYGFEDTPLPALPGTVRDHIRELEADLATSEETVEGIAAKTKELAVHRRALTVLKALREDQRNTTLAHTKSVHGKWAQVVTGYMREKDVPRLREVFEREFPNASLLIEDPGPDENVPVSLSLPKHVRPVQMLVNLFGLPEYHTFDPSPFLMVNFYIFFGICFSDLAYGILLVLLSLYIMKRTRPYEGVYNFAKLLLFSGFSTMVFGMLLGSWFGDLYEPQYLGERNLMWKIMTTVSVVDPLEKPVVVLLISLAIGMANQFYGIALKMYGALKRGDKATAIYDCLLWLIILPGFVVLVSTLFVKPPPFVLYGGLALFIVGAVGLILTQGRTAKNPIARLLTGVVSLYGIVGSYGLTSFIGDTMSYCRLLALGLTTSIVALSFNMMANLLRPIPHVGIVLFILVLVVGHVFNFFISILGAFVHSMRLIFVEFFGRFYESGAKPFAPLGFDSQAAILRKES